MKLETRNSTAFSLIEVLIAVFILGIGLIMVATIFPVAGNWTRQSTDDSVSQTIALNALGVLHAHYGIGGNLHSNVASINTTLQGLPSFITIPVTERTYLYGASSPFPVQNPTVATYYWSALARQNPAMAGNSATSAYDLYILVFKKGDASQTFAKPTTEVLNVRDISAPTNPAGFGYLLEPTLASAIYNKGVYSPSLATVINATPPVGFIGIGASSGTVFRQNANLTVTPFGAIARPLLKNAGENVFYAPAAVGTTTSPLVYVYQTTVSF